MTGGIQVSGGVGPADDHHGDGGEVLSAEQVFQVLESC
jgi:hypothetical protein